MQIVLNKGEQQYLHLLKKIMNEGVHEETRNGTTISLFGEKMEFNMDDGFPLLTTKKMGYKTILRELLWFIRGSTSNHELIEKNVHIWSQNSTREFLDSRGLSYEEGDLGPVYGFQWRHSGAEYVDCHTDYTGQGIDQLKNVIHLIQTEPNSRRIIMNAWNPSDLDKMALPPCHVMSQFHVDTINNTLNCQLYQRSGDMFLVKFNSNGDKIWTKQMGDGVGTYAYGVDTDSNNNIYVTGITKSGLDGNTHLGDNDGILIKYNSDGTKQWTKQFGSSAGDESFGIAIDSSNNIYAAGYTGGAFDSQTNSGGNDIFLIK